MAIADVTQKNIEENSAAAAFEMEELNKKQTLQAELTNTIADESVKQTNIFSKMFGMQEDQARAAKEAAAKAKREGKGGDSPTEKELNPKGKSIFGMIGSVLKVLGGGFLKMLGPMMKVLKFGFGALKMLSIALGAAGLLATGVFFMMPEAKQKKIIENATKFLKSAGVFLEGIGKAFTSGFMGGMEDQVDATGKPIREGLMTKLDNFKAAWTKVLEKLTNMRWTIGGETYEGLAGIANMAGDIFNKIGGWVVDILTGVANFILDPKAFLSRMAGKMSGVIANMGSSIAQFFDDFFTAENIGRIFEDLFGIELPEQLRKKLADGNKQRVKSRIAELEKDIEISKDVIANEEKRRKEGKKVDEALLAENQVRLKFFEDQKREYELQEKNQNQKIARIQAEIEIEAEMGDDLSVLKKEQEKIEADLKKYDALEPDTFDFDTTLGNIAGRKGGFASQFPTIGGQDMNLEQLLDFVEKIKAAGGITEEFSLMALGDVQSAANVEVEKLLARHGTRVEDMHLLMKDLPALIKKREEKIARLEELKNDQILQDFKDNVKARAADILPDIQSDNSNANSAKILNNLQRQKIESGSNVIIDNSVNSSSNNNTTVPLVTPLVVPQDTSGLLNAAGAD